MTTELNDNNYPSNINNSNLEQINENRASKKKRLPPNYQEKLKEFAQPKKRYYLASCDDNLEMLKKDQIQGLTDILIALKKEHDNIKVESQKVLNETSQLEKKIIMIQEMDAKTEKKNVESKFQNENIKKAIEFTRERLKEEEYKKKTLTALLSKIKKDININEISLQKSYDKQGILNQKLQRQKLLENEIKAKGNQINSQISSQIEKNKKDQKEYNLQVQYYNTIIAQKLEFIRSAEERKERQIRIAQEAKKSSGDKEEKEKREKLQLLYLINNYLQKKMEKELEKNREVEDTFSKIKLICGTNNLKTMIDKILLKEKKYNYTIKKINEQEEKKKILNKEIKELQEKFVKLKNEMVIDIDTVDKKDIHIIKSKDFDNSLNNELLINEEIELNDKYNQNKELYDLVSLRYDQVINSLRKLCTEQSISNMKDQSQNASGENNNKSGVSNIDTGKQSNNLDINNNLNKDGNNNINDNSNNNNDNNNNVEDYNRNQDINHTQKSEESEELLFLRDILSYKKKEDKNTNHDNNANNNINDKNENNNNINDNNNNQNNNNENNNNINNNVDVNNNNNQNEIINNNSNINNNSSYINNINRNASQIDENEEKRLIKAYKDYLNQAEKTIDTLFLIKSKNDFLQMIRDKASEYEDVNKTIRIIKRYQDKNRKSKMNISRSVIISKDNDDNNELEYYAEEFENTKDKEIQEKIFRTYMNAERRKMEKFINNEREGKQVNKK